MVSYKTLGIVMLVLMLTVGFTLIAGCVNKEESSNEGESSNGDGGTTGDGTSGGGEDQQNGGDEGTTPQLNLDRVESFYDLLNLARGMSYRWEDSKNNNRGEVRYTVVGEETVDNVECWKVNLSYSSLDSSETTLWIVWISKSDGRSIQIEMPGGIIYSGPMVEDFWPSISSAILLPFTTWNYYEMINPPANVGTVTYIGSEEKTYGDATLTVLTYRFTPASSNPLNQDISHIDISGSILDDNHGLLVSLEVYYKDGSWWRWGLHTVTLW